MQWTLLSNGNDGENKLHNNDGASRETMQCTDQYPIRLIISVWEEGWMEGGKGLSMFL